MKSMSIVRGIGLVLLAAMLWQCGGSGVYVPVTRPAEINLKEYKRIAIGEIKGEGGEDLGEELTQALFDSRRFEVLDRENLNRILREHNLNLAGYVDPEKAAEIGKIVGSAAMVFGRMSEYDYKEENSREESTNDKTGDVTRVNTRVGKSLITARLQVVDIQTSKILAINKFTATRSDKKSAVDERPVKIDQGALFAECRLEVIDRFMKKIAPYTERVYVQFEEDERIPALGIGYQMAKAGDWEGAISRFEQAVSDYSSVPGAPMNKLYYNLGISYMYTDQFTKAEATLRKAIAAKPEGRYQNAMSTLQQRRQELKRLREQLDDDDNG